MKSKTPKMIPVILLLSFIYLFLPPATPCRASRIPPVDATFTLAFDNEPLGTALKRISQKTGWKIKAPEKWMDRRITQTLNEVTLPAGLRSLLQDAGIENRLLSYDERLKEIIIFDTDAAGSGQSSDPINHAGAPAAQPVFKPTAPAPIAAPLMSRPPIERGNLRATRRARRRDDFSEEE